MEPRRPWVRRCKEICPTKYYESAKLLTKKGARGSNFFAPWSLYDSTFAQVLPNAEAPTGPLSGGPSLSAVLKKCRGVYSGVPLSFNPAQVEAFWAKWEKLALRRKNPLLPHPTDWDEVVTTMREANMLLSEAPDHKLRRLARLSRLPLDSDAAQAIQRARTKGKSTKKSFLWTTVSANKGASGIWEVA